VWTRLGEKNGKEGGISDPLTMAKPTLQAQKKRKRQGHDCFHSKRTVWRLGERESKRTKEQIKLMRGRNVV